MKTHIELLSEVFVENYQAMDLKNRLLKMKTILYVMIAKALNIDMKGKSISYLVDILNNISSTADPRNKLIIPFAPLLEMCRLSNKNRYQMGADFSEDLARCKINVPSNSLPREEATYYIQLPKNMRFKNKDGTYIEDAYVMVTPDAVNREQRHVYILCPDRDAKGDILFTNSYAQYNLDSVDDLDAYMRLIIADNKDEAMSLDAVSFFIKCLLYLQTGDPDLRTAKAPEIPETKKEKKRRHFFRDAADISLLDVMLVGYDHMKKRVYHVDGTTVCGHFRKQPCGPGRTKVVIIWIDEHERTYNK